MYSYYISDVGLTGLMISALECELSVLCSIYISDDVLRGPTCSDPVGAVDWRGVFFKKDLAFVE